MLSLESPDLTTAEKQHTYLMLPSFLDAHDRHVSLTKDVPQTIIAAEIFHGFVSKGLTGIPIICMLNQSCSGRILFCDRCVARR